MLFQALQERSAPLFTSAEYLADGGGDQAGISDRGQADEEHAVLEVIDQVGSDLQAQPCLAGAPPGPSR